MASLNGQSLFSNAISGLQSTYSILSQSYPNGFTLDNLSTSLTNNTFSSYLNSSYISYLTTNFNSLDKNNDGKVTQSEISNLTNNILTQGLTYNQVMQLCSQNGTNSSSLVNTVLNYFDQIDTNHDGKVTTSEINAFSMDVTRKKMETQYKSFNPNSITVFYGSDTQEEPSSIMDSLLPNLDDSNS